MKICFLLYPTSKVKVDEDSSFWIIHELVARGHSVDHFESAHLLWEQGTPRAYVRRAAVHPKKGFLGSPLSARAVALEDYDVLFIRKEPPFDNEYLHALQLLALLKEKVFILNDPEGIALSNEKLIILDFPRFLTDTLVTSDAGDGLRFARNLGKEVVVKPLNQKGGTGIFKFSYRDPDAPQRLYAATSGGGEPVMLQRYLPHGASGDKRLLVLNGKIIGAFSRRAARGDFRSNLGLGGSMHKTSVTRTEKKMVAEMSSLLLKRGLYFVGLDVIAGRLSEVNVTSPSGIPEVRQLYGKRLEEDIADFIERRL